MAFDPCEFPSAAEDQMQKTRASIAGGIISPLRKNIHCNWCTSYRQYPYVRNLVNQIWHNIETCRFTAARKLFGAWQRKQKIYHQ